MLLALVPLAVVVFGGVALELSMARHVHHDVVRLFEELREVALARALVEELHGVDNWQRAVPSADARSQPMIIADVQRHTEAAIATLRRFPRDLDPSDDVHVDEESRLLERILTQLRAIEAGLRDDRPLGEMTEQVELALNAANAIEHAVDVESREIGTSLDGRTDTMFQVLVVLGICSIVTVGALSWILLRRVLQPVEELRDVTERFGRGELDLKPEIMRNDELGQLAQAFKTMAGDLRRSQIDLQQRVEERSREVLQSAKLAQLGTLAAGIAHEINNPLASIVACSDGLLRDLARGGGDPAGMQEYLEILRKEAMRARDITATLLRFAHQDQAGRERFDLGAQVAEIATLFTHQVEARGVSLTVERDPGEALEIDGEPGEWRQVFFNLLRNALDASPAGSTITIRARRDGGDVELEVEDRGEGIPKELREQVFEPFFTTKGPGKGTGLGLAIVHRIVVAHGGSIRIDGNEPGTRFTIRVPAAR